MQYKIAQPVKAQFELQTGIYKSTLADISDQEAGILYSEHLNPIKWVAGHCLNTRLMVISILTINEQDRSIEQYFKRGTSKMLPTGCPSIEEILAKWDKTAILLSEAFAAASQEHLLSAPPFQTTIPDHTLLGFVAYMAYHEAMHIGQLTILRKLVHK